MTRYYQPEGTKLNDSQMDRLRQAFERQRTTPDALVAKLEEQRTRELDIIADTRSMAVVPLTAEQQDVMPLVPQAQRLEPATPRVVLCDNESVAPEAREWYGTSGPVALNAHAHRQLAKTLGIPQKYYQRMLADDPALLATNANRWLHTMPERNNGKPVLKMVRTLQVPTNGDGKLPVRCARGVLSNSYRRLDALEVVQELLPVLQDPSSGWQVQQCGVTDISLAIELKHMTLAADVGVGDEVALAVRISTSDVGRRALTASFGVERLVCTNLMTVPQWDQRVVHMGGKQAEMVEVLSDRTLRLEDKTTIAKFRDVVLAMADPTRLARLMEDLQAGAAAQLADPVAACQVLGNNMGLGEGELHAVQGAMTLAENTNTVWGLANALTATARQMDFERKAELEAAAGKLMTAPRSWQQYTEAAA